MKAAQLLAQSLKEEGVKYVFGIPGEETLDLIDALHEVGINFVLTHHEQAAAFMAATYGRLTGRAGVCLSTLGPGALNLATGLGFAALGGMPVVAITAQSGIRENWKREFQHVDIVFHFRPLAKWSAKIENPDDVAYMIRRAFAIAEAQRPGVAHLEFPEDIAAANTDSLPLTRHGLRRPIAEEKALAQAVDLLKAAKCPLILVSHGAVRKRVADALQAFVSQTRIYATHTQMGKGTLSDNDPHSLLTLGIHRKDWPHCAIERADVIITLGYHALEYSPAIWNRTRDKKIIHLDFSDPRIDHYYNPEVSVVGDIAASLDMLRVRLVGCQWDTSYFARLRMTLLEKVTPKPSDAFPLTPQTILARAREALAGSDILISDVGAHKIWIARAYPTFEYQTCLIDNGLAAMGGALPSAIAAKLIFPDRRVLAITGDGGFLMNMQEMVTAKRLATKIVVLVWNDGGYGMIKWHAQAHGFEPRATDFQNPDYVTLAQSFGWQGYRAARAADLPEMLKKSFAGDGPALIDCPVDSAETYRVFTEELQSLTCPI